MCAHNVESAKKKVIKPPPLTREEITDKIPFYEREMKQAARDLLKHYQELLLMD